MLSEVSAEVSGAFLAGTSDEAEGRSEGNWRMSRRESPRMMYSAAENTFAVSGIGFRVERRMKALFNCVLRVVHLGRSTCHAISGREN